MPGYNAGFPPYVGYVVLHFVVKLFPEITIKSGPVRKRLTKQLRNNLRILLKPLCSDIDIQRDWEKIEVSVSDDDPALQDSVTEILKNTPGIANFSLVHAHSVGDLDDILDIATEHWRDELAGKTFCVRVRRSGKHDFRSPDVERYVGGGLLKRTAATGVKLDNPDVRVQLEIRQDKLFLVRDTQAGLGGFPLGFQDSVLSLISGGFDSTVSSYFSIRRGLRTHFCFFNLGGRAHETGVKEVAHFLWRKFASSHRVKFVSVPFDTVVAEILEKIDNAYMGVILKRMMLRAAEHVARDLGAGSLVTGESVAQVSSQTLANLSVIDAVTDCLVLRPLAMVDKQEIIDIARKIGTEQFAANMPEYCGVISRSPTTRAKLERVVAEEHKFDLAILDQALARRSVSSIETVVDELEGQAEGVEIFRTPVSGAIVIDIRHPDEIEANPLKAARFIVFTIPFFDLAEQYARLDQNATYLLYCGKGVMSRLHAEILREQGFTNVAVFRP